MNKQEKKRLIKKAKEYGKYMGIFAMGVILTLIMVLCASCNATRTITTTQTHIKGQDTITTMTTRTTESYDASVKQIKF